MTLRAVACYEVELGEGEAFARQGGTEGSESGEDGEDGGTGDGEEGARSTACSGTHTTTNKPI